MLFGLELLFSISAAVPHLSSNWGKGVAVLMYWRLLHPGQDYTGCSLSAAWQVMLGLCYNKRLRNRSETIPGVPEESPELYGILE
jgi:hypothetical protein